MTFFTFPPKCEGCQADTLQCVFKYFLTEKRLLDMRDMAAFETTRLQFNVACTLVSCKAKDPMAYWRTYVLERQITIDYFSALIVCSLRL